MYPTYIVHSFPQLQNLDPFLMLDEFQGEAPAGFPDHPHRGFETVRTDLILLFSFDQSVIIVLM